jgi:hypothetical protein
MEFTKDARFDTPKYHEFTIPNVECAYLYLFQPDTAFGDSKWKVTMWLPEGLAAQLKGVGFNVKTWGKKDKESPYDGREYLVATRKTHTGEGKTMYPAKVYDSSNKYWNSEIAIGQGSRCNIMVASKYMEVKGETILPCYLNAVQVLEHVEYSSSPFEDTTSTEPGDSPF